MDRRRIKFTAMLSVLVLAFSIAFGGFFAPIPTAEAASIDGPLFGPAVRIIQGLLLQVNSIESTLAGFADSFTTKQLTFDRATGNKVDVQTLCIGSTCIDEAQLQALLAGEAASTVQTNGAVSDATTTDATTTIVESPILQINGDNPAIIQVGDTYNDLGATITGPQPDLNLGIQTYLNGTLTSNIVIDTSAAATDTIDYVATDQTGLTSTSTRNIIIEASPSIVPTDDASSTEASSTPQ